MDVLKEVHKAIDRDWQGHLRETRALLRVPSVSQTGEGIEETASMLADMLVCMGVKPRVFRANKKSHPVVGGYLDAGADTTVILYGMYDVQPVGDPDDWDHPPFGATIVRKRPYGEVLVNRGVYNSKGALAGMLMAIKTMLDKDALPLNIHFLLEGEEETGGLSLPRYVRKNKERLSKSDVAFGFDYSENSDGVPVISLGMKGCVYFDLVAEGSDKGGPTDGEIHSSEAVWVESPVWRLVHAVSTLVDDRQVLAVDGLWDEVLPPSKEDLELIKVLAKRIDIKGHFAEEGVKTPKFDESPEELLRRYMFEPSLNIDGLIAGFTEEGTKTVLPDRAMAKIDIRTVPDMTLEGTHAKVLEHLKKRGFTDIKMRNYVDYPWTKVSVKEDVSQACIEAMKYHGKDPEVWPMMAGSAPFYLFDQVLGVPWGGVGLGHGGRAHAPNEFAVVKGMREFEKSVATVFWKYVELASR